MEPNRIMTTGQNAQRSELAGAQTSKAQTSKSHTRTRTYKINAR
jgi:hypothetical protein